MPWRRPSYPRSRRPCGPRSLIPGRNRLASGTAFPWPGLCLPCAPPTHFTSPAPQWPIPIALDVHIVVGWQMGITRLETCPQRCLFGCQVAAGFMPLKAGDGGCGVGLSNKACALKRSVVADDRASLRPDVSLVGTTQYSRVNGEIVRSGNRPHRYPVTGAGSTEAASGKISTRVSVSVDKSSAM